MNQKSAAGAALIGGGSGRSISYPSLSLPEAIDKARSFYELERKNSAPASVAAEHWGFSPKSSGGRVAIASLLQFDLLQSSNHGHERKVRLTDTALDILLREQDSTAYLDAVSKAAKSPKLYREILTRWAISELPSDASLKAFLLREKDINPVSVELIIKKFRQTIAFANFAADDGPAVIFSAEDLLVDDWTAAKSIVQRPSLRRVYAGGRAYRANPSAENESNRREHALGAEFNQDVFSLPEGNVTLTWPAFLSSDSHSDVVDWLKLMERKIGRSTQETEAPPLTHPSLFFSEKDRK